MVSITVSLSPVVKYHGLGRRHLQPRGFLMRPLLGGGTLGGQRSFLGCEREGDLSLRGACREKTLHEQVE